MKRRNFFSLAAGVLGAARVVVAQEPIAGKPTNLDQHGDPTNMKDMPTTGKRLAGEDGATYKYARPQTQVAAHAVEPRATGPQAGVAAVSTRSNDNTRSGVNRAETQLTVGAIRQRGLRLLFSYRLPGDLRGAEAQVLIAPNVKMNDGSVFDMAIVASMSNTVFAFDAHNHTPLWTRRLGTPITNSRGIDGWMINDHWGILSTPVIDEEATTLYCVTWTSADGSPGRAVHTLHCLKLADGTQAKPPVSLEQATYDPGHGLPLQKFQGSQRKQRAGLTLATIAGKKTILIAAGTILEVTAANRGWIIAVDVETNQLSAGWTAAARYSGGGIWGAGQGIAADENGFLYCLTGNGAFDGITEFGESFVKLHYTPPSNGTPGKLQPVSWFSPFSDAGRAGGDQTATRVTTDIGGGWDDMDLGSGGVVYIPGWNLLLGAGKDGISYCLDANNLGNTTLADFANPAKNYAKAKSINWFTYFNPGSATPNRFADLNQLFDNRTHHEHSTPVVFKTSTGKAYAYCWGENGNGRAWTLDKNGQMKYLGCTAEVASAQSPVPPGGMPGGMMSLSSNGDNDAVLWANVPLQDANRMISQGILYAYDATNIGRFSDGSGALTKLWESPQFVYNKFMVPTISGGKVYLPTYDSQVNVYGLT